MANKKTGAVAVADDTGTTQQLEVCLRDFGFQVMTADEFMQAGVEELNRAMVHACKAGTAFWAAQEALRSGDSASGGVGSFKEWIANAGLTEQRVYESIKLARFYSRLPDDKRGQMLRLGKKSALLLAGLPQEEIDRAAEGGQDLLTDAETMSYAELHEELRAAQRREANLNAEIERKDSQLTRLQAGRGRTTEFLLRTEEIREECMALQAGAQLNIEGLYKLFDGVANEDQSLPEWRLQIEQAWVTANVVAARALEVVARMREMAPVADLPERIQSQHTLTPAEAERWLLDWPMVENRFEAAKAVRATQRELSQPARPGRPTKEAAAAKKAKG